MTLEQNFNLVVAITRGTDAPDAGELPDLVSYGNARRAAILWADRELTRLRAERDAATRSADMAHIAQGELRAENKRLTRERDEAMAFIRRCRAALAGKKYDPTWMTDLGREAAKIANKPNSDDEIDRLAMEREQTADLLPNPAHLRDVAITLRKHRPDGMWCEEECHARILGVWADNIDEIFDLLEARPADENKMLRVDLAEANRQIARLHNDFATLVAAVRNSVTLTEAQESLSTAGVLRNLRGATLPPVVAALRSAVDAFTEEAAAEQATGEATMSETIRLRATIVLEYDADPEHYSYKTPGAMAEQDEQNFADPAILFETLESEPYTVVVETVKEARP